MEEKLFDELLAGIQWMGAHMRGEVEAERAFERPEPDVKAIREATGFSQSVGCADDRKRIVREDDVEPIAPHLLP